MATSTLEKFPYCGDRHIPGEPSACPLLAQILGLIGAAESSEESPQQGADISVLDVCFQSPANRAGQGLALTNHIKPGDTFYYLAASLSSVLKLSPKQDSHSGLFAHWEVQIEMGGCCK